MKILKLGKNKQLNEDLDLTGENAIANKETAGLSQSQIVLKRFLRHRAAVFSVGMLISIIIFVFSAIDSKIGPISINGWWKHKTDDLPPLLYEGCPDGTVGCPTISMRPKWLGGAGIGFGEHPFGQDDIGRDYFALVMRGAQRSVMVMFIIGFFAATIGIVVGAVAGYFRGWIDAVLMRFTDFIITIPSVIIGAVIGAKFGNLGAAVLAVYLGLLHGLGSQDLFEGSFSPFAKGSSWMQPE